MIYKIGITGGAGSGKTLFCSHLETLGAIRIDADEVGREVVDSHVSVQAALRATFGDVFFDRSGLLKRRELGRHVFKYPAERQKLNQIVWPDLLERIRHLMDNAPDNPSRLLVVDMAILFEAGVEAWFDEIVLVLSSDPVRKERLLKRENWTEEDADACLDNQGDYTLFADRCAVIENNHTADELKALAAHFYQTRMERIRNSLDF